MLPQTADCALIATNWPAKAHTIQQTKYKRTDFTTNDWYIIGTCMGYLREIISKKINKSNVIRHTSEPRVTLPPKNEKEEDDSCI